MRLALFEDLRALVDHRIDAALQDLLVGDAAAVDALLGGEIEDDLLDDRARAWRCGSRRSRRSRRRSSGRGGPSRRGFRGSSTLATSPSTSRCRGRRGRSSRTGPSASRNRRAPGRRPRAWRLRGSASAPRAGAGASMRLPTKPWQTPTSTAILPILRASCMTVAITCFAVFAPRTISSSRMTLAGEKKCRPMTCSGRLVTDGDLVDVRGTRCWWRGSRPAWRCASSLRNTSFLIVHVLEHRLDDEVAVGERRPGRA